MERGFVQFLTSAGNCEGKRIIEFDKSVWCDVGTHVPITECQVDRPSFDEDEMRQTVKGKTKVALATCTWLEFGELVGSSPLQGGVVR